MQSIPSVLVMLASIGTPPLSVPGSPPISNHPILGEWILEAPDVQCAETYNFRPDGTRRFTSGDEIGESVFEISSVPSSKGFYKIIDIIVKDNGKKDCGGAIVEIGHRATLYVRIHPSGDVFMICQDEVNQTCFALFKRVRRHDP